MPWADDPVASSRLMQGVAIGLALVVVATAATWALLPVRVPPMPEIAAQDTGATPGDAIASVDPDAWGVDLWRPLRDPPPVERAAPPPPPMTAALLAIAERDGRPVAVLELEQGGRLHYLPAGASAGRYTVERIETDRVVLSDDGRETTLELPR